MKRNIILCRAVEKPMGPYRSGARNKMAISKRKLRFLGFSSMGYSYYKN
jgi:hypothetical protein